MSAPVGGAMVLSSRDLQLGVDARPHSTSDWLLRFFYGLQPETAGTTRNKPYPSERAKSFSEMEVVGRSLLRRVGPI